MNEWIYNCASAISTMKQWIMHQKFNEWIKEWMSEYIPVLQPSKQWNNAAELCINNLMNELRNEWVNISSIGYVYTP